MKNRITASALFIVVLFALSLYRTFGGLSQEQVKKNLPQLLGASNQGLEFVLGFIPAWMNEPPSGDSSVPGIRLYISSAVGANVRIQALSKGFEKNIITVANRTSEVYIPYDVAQVSKKNSDRDLPEPAQVYPGGAVVVTSDAPIVCYGLVRYPHTSDGYLALPVSSLGKRYVVASYNGPTGEPDIAEQYLTPYTAIVGAYDNTKVSFTYGGNANGRVETSDGKNLTPGKSDEKTLNRGDVWLIPARGPKPDITGSYVGSNKPVACFSGNLCSYIPIDVGFCDHIIEQDIPMNLWGTKYFVTPFMDRKKNSPVRLFAGADNVKIYRNGWSDQVATIPKMFGPENEGWVEIRAAEGEPKAVTLFSNDPFNVVQYNAGMQDDNVDSDPFQLNLSSVEQFQNHIAFNTPGVYDGLKFERNYINLVYLATPKGEIPEDMEFGYFEEQGTVKWIKLSDKFGSASGYEFIDSTYPNPDRSYYCKQIKLPYDGVFHIRAKDKFMAYAYGSSWCDSYGFPTSFVTADRGKRDTSAPIIVYTIDEDGFVPNKKLAGQKPATATDVAGSEEERSNLSIVYLDKEYSYNYDFSHDNFVAGDDYKINWSLTPRDPGKDARAVLTFADRCGNDTTVIIEHWGTNLAILPAAKDFGCVMAGKESDFTFKLKNESQGGVSKLSQLRLEKGDQGFSIDDSYDGSTPLMPGANRAFKIRFKSDKEGKFTDRIGYGDGKTFTYIADVKATISSSGPWYEIMDVAFSPTNINTTVDSTAIVVLNNGSSNLLITGFHGPANPAFHADIAGFDLSEDQPYVLSPGQNLKIKISFSPTEIASYMDSIIVFTNTSSGDSVCVLTGEGSDDKSIPDRSSTLSVRALPNPVDSRGGAIEFENPGDGTVEIILFNSLNQQVAVLNNGWLKAGRQSVRIPVETLPGGAYAVRVTAAGGVKTAKFIIEK